MAIFKRSDFPFFTRYPTLAYLDNAATTQKPQLMLDTLIEFYTAHNANIKRGVYRLAEDATQHYEQARATIAQFFGALPEEIIITKGATEAINAVAVAWGDVNIHVDDEIIVTELEHHANFLPWLALAKRKNAVIRMVPIHSDGTLNYAALSKLLSSKTKLIAVTHESNVTGASVDIVSIIKQAHAIGAKVLIDGVQSAPHERINLHALDADFFVCSAHKMLGPTGVGALFVRQSLHAALRPYQQGGGMVETVSLDRLIFRAMPYLLEAGTPPIAQAVGFAAALNYLTKVDFVALQKDEARLCALFIDEAQKIPGIRLLGPLDELKNRGHLVSFIVDGIHAHDVAAFLDKYDICIRAGNHCAQPVHKALGIDASVRTSFYGYNTEEEVIRLIEALKKIYQVFKQ